jgi:DNA-binding Lrp family transcriptional regulator
MVEIKGVKLDKTDRIILAELDKNCRISTSRLAKKTRKSRQTVEYRIKRLVEQGIITGFTTYINPHKFGYETYRLYFKLRNIPEEKEKMLRYLRSSHIVYWVSESGGVWDLMFAAYAKSNHELYEFKNDLITRFGRIVVKSDWSTFIDGKQFPRNYFIKEIKPPFDFAGQIEYHKMNKIDFSILSKMLNNARIPLSKLAREVKSTPTRVAKRMKRMEELGIIIQYRIEVNIKKLELELYNAIIHLDRYNKQDEKKLLEYFSALPNIHYLTRPMWDLEIEMIVENVEEFFKIMDEVREQFPNVIRDIETVLMRTDEWLLKLEHFQSDLS